MNAQDFAALVERVKTQALEQASAAGLLDNVNTHTSTEEMLESAPNLVLNQRRSLFDQCGGAAAFWIAFAAWLTETRWLDPHFPSRNIELRHALQAAFNEDARPEGMPWEQHGPACEAFLAALDGHAPKLPGLERERNQLSQEVMAVTCERDKLAPLAKERTDLKKLRQESAMHAATKARIVTPEQRRAILAEVSKRKRHNRGWADACTSVANDLNHKESQLRSALGIRHDHNFSAETIRSWLKAHRR